MLIADSRRLDTSRYDCFVVGSGPVGLTIAMELAKTNKRTLVFETHEGASDCAPSIAYGHYAGAYWNAHAIRALGGTSAVWSGWVTTLSDLDFDNPAVGVRWPIDRSELEPYYLATADILDRHPSIVGWEKRLFPPWVYRPFSHRRGTRFRLKYQDLLERSPHIHVALGCTVTAVEANDSRSLVTRFRYFHHDSGGSRQVAVRPGQSLVVAAGGIGNAQLLLQPRSDGTVPVGNESGLAGKYLMEHPHFFGAAQVVLDEDLDRHLPAEPFGGSVHTLVLDSSRMRELGLYGCSLEFSRNDDETGDMPEYLAAKFGTPHYAYQINLRTEMLPSAANRVVLTAEKDRTGLHRPSAHCVLDARDFLNAELTLRELGHSLIEGNRGRIRIENDRIYRRVQGGGHIMGTTRMGDSPATSVVDRDCRLHGYRNFFAAGCSLFPTGGYANPTFTAVALASRLAREIGRA